jgi:nitrate reductase gamma subunit
MEETEIVPETAPDTSWKMQTLVIGGVLGALVGVGAAFLMTRRAEQKGEKLSMSTGQGVKLGVLLAGLMRSILTLGDD